MSAWLQRQWYTFTPWQVLLWPLSQLFRLLAFVRRLAYRTGWLSSWRAPVPVIVVGNISVGGTGKTPFVIWLATYLIEQGYRPGIVSRGYGGHVAAITPVTAKSDAAEVGDEPLLLARRTRCPVWIGRNRPAAAQALLAAHPECDVIICDDGMQHYALARDIEIAVVDAQRRFGNGQLLPAGPLRESPSRLGEVDAVVINGAGARPGEYTMRLCGSTFYKVHDANLSASPAELAGSGLHAVAGIGNPQRFFDALRALSLQVTEHAFPDHHAYRVADLQFEGARAVLMTEKDAVKCAAFAQPNWWYLRVVAEVSNGLGEVLLRKLKENHGH